MGVSSIVIWGFVALFIVLSIYGLFRTVKKANSVCDRCEIPCDKCPYDDFRPME